MKRRVVTRNNWRSLLIAAALAATSPLASAQELYFLALQQPGQASVSIDHGSSTAYIVDLGKDGDGNSILLDGRPLMDRLADIGIKNLVFVCSHPHSDHMGGIRALFKTPRAFFADDAMDSPRFTSVSVLEGDAPTSLASLLVTSLPEHARAMVHRLSANDANALSMVSKPEHSVFVETIPYDVSEKGGPHRRSIVTRTVLGGSYSVLDFDDADSSVIQQVVDTLKARGVDSVDAFVVPHHGSAYHDIEPILSMNPKRAIITVNPSNRYGHPAPSILLPLIERLGAENVLFTGSVDHIEIGPAGVLRAQYTAANRDSYALFVLPNQLRAERRGMTGDEREQYERLRQVMLEDSVVRQAESHDTTVALLRERVAGQGSTLSPEFEVGYVPRGGIPPAELAKHRVFSPAPSEPAGSANVVYVTSKPGDTEGINASSTPVTAREVADRLRLQRGATEIASTVELRYETEAGFPNGLEAPRSQVTEPRPEVSRPVARNSGDLPNGGMVYLTGGKMFSVGSSTSLIGATLDLCGDALCMRDAGGSDADTYAIPINVGPLFAEVWTRVYDRNIDAFYLSINPTRRFLEELSSDFDKAPEDKLRFGVEPGEQGMAANEVVTAGDIERSEIGRVLWEADVKFKSAALGFNVLTGPRPATVVPAGLPAGFHETDLEADLEVEPEARWCRLYWSSGAQELVVDQAGKRVRLEGEAVKAAAEAMRLKDGRLVTARGTWCADVQALAQRLQRQANASPGGDPLLSELRELAEIQNFVRWIRDNGVPITAALRQRIEEIPSKQAFVVPTWTSGVRSSSPVFVQQENVLVHGKPTYLVHVSFARADTVTDCVVPQWETHKVDFPLHGYEFNEATDRWESKEGADIASSRFVKRWMSGLAQRIASCSGATILPANGVLPAEEGVGELESTLGVQLHTQAFQYHGGVLLGSPDAQSFLESAWKKENALRGLDGKLLFQRFGEDLHFWNRSNSASGGTEAAEHVVVRHATVIDAFANAGRLRFLVEAGPGAVVRKELRTGPTSAFPMGFEWSSAQHGLQGEPILAKAAWPCAAHVGDGCLRAAELDEDALWDALGEDADVLSMIETQSVEPSIWVVDLDLASIEQELERRWDELDPSDTAVGLSLAKAYANWGFSDLAAEKAESVIERIAGDTEDLVLGGVLPSADRELARMITGWLLRAKLDEIQEEAETGSAPTPVVLKRLQQLEKGIASTTPDIAAGLWNRLATMLTDADQDEEVDPKTRAQKEAAVLGYQSRARRSAALAFGNPDILDSADEDVFGAEDDQNGEDTTTVPPEP